MKFTIISVLAAIFSQTAAVTIATGGLAAPIAAAVVGVAGSATAIAGSAAQLNDARVHRDQAALNNQGQNIAIATTGSITALASIVALGAEMQEGQIVSFDCWKYLIDPETLTPELRDQFMREGMPMEYIMDKFDISVGGNDTMYIRGPNNLYAELTLPGFYNTITNRHMAHVRAPRRRITE